MAFPYSNNLQSSSYNQKLLRYAVKHNLKFVVGAGDAMEKQRQTALATACHSAWPLSTCSHHEQQFISTSSMPQHTPTGPQHQSAGRSSQATWTCRFALLYVYLTSPYTSNETRYNHDFMSRCTEAQTQLQGVFMGLRMHPKSYTNQPLSG